MADTSREPAKVIQDDATDWVIRVDRGLSDEDQSALDAWLAADVRHQGAFARAQALWMESNRARIFRGSGKSESYSAGTDTPSRSRGASKRPMALAASFLLLILGATWGWQWWVAGRFSTSVGEIRRIALPDGSVVTLDTDSTIQVDYGKQGRIVKLSQGVALFDVAHDPHRPFIVEAGSLRVRAVGTSFIVRHLEEPSAEVTVTRGVVDVWQEVTVPEPSIRMKAGLRLAATKHTVGPPQSMTEEQISRATAWQNGIINLDGRFLEEAAEEFNRYNELKIHVDPSLARQSVVGRFSVNDPRSFTTAAAAMLGARVSIEGSELKLEPRVQ